MDFDHIQFYVDDAQRCREWFTQVLGFQPLSSTTTESDQIELIHSGQIVCLLCSPLADQPSQSAVTHYLQHHPPGVCDLAFCVKDVKMALQQAEQQGATILQPLTIEQQEQGELRWGKVKGWGTLAHTLVERCGQTTLVPASLIPAPPPFLCKTYDTEGTSASPLGFTQIDHAVLNVSENQLQAAVNWYQRIFGFQTQRYFDIQTHRSGLRSEVLIHPQGQVKFPINEPTSVNSQVQEFLDHNHGAGIQHIALATANIVDTITQLRARGLSLLDIPSSYYPPLRDQFEQHFPHLDWLAIEQQNILVDIEGEPSAGILLQTFSQPIFNQPTFFWEIIERRQQAQGFGQRNFLALFEAIEREQQKRGVLL
jgi:4-hydroxyphenylpyruvate dioxygenase